MALYRIRDWDELYENNRTRELKNLQFVLIPNKQDGDGYATLIDHEDGPAHFGAWVAILQVASKCKPRGTLVRGCGKPHTPESIGRMSHLPAELCRDALERLKSEEIGWIEEVEVVEKSTTSNNVGTIPQDGARLCRPLSERNGTERNGNEKKRTSTTTADDPPWEDPKKVLYMQLALADLGSHMGYSGPDTEIAKQTLIAGRGAEPGEIVTLLENMARDGKRPSKSWGWYPTMVARMFG